jgi:hypothetical protein
MATEKKTPATPATKKRTRTTKVNTYRVNTGDTFRLVNALSAKAATAFVVGNVTAARATIQDGYDAAGRNVVIEDA